jgi:hypothetical protein
MRQSGNAPPSHVIDCALPRIKTPPSPNLRSWKTNQSHYTSIPSEKTRRWKAMPLPWARRRLNLKRSNWRKSWRPRPGFQTSRSILRTAWWRQIFPWINQPKSPASNSSTALGRRIRQSLAERTVVLRSTWPARGLSCKFGTIFDKIKALLLVNSEQSW